MRDMKVSNKIVVSFSIIIALTLVLAGAAVACTLYIDNSYTSAYEDSARPLPAITKVVDSVGQLRLEVRNAVIYDNDSADYASALERVQQYKDATQQALDESRSFFNEEEEFAAVDAIAATYKDELLPVAEAILAGVAAGDDSQLESLMEQCNATGVKLNEQVTALSDKITSDGETASSTNTAMTRTLVIIFCVLAVAALVVAIVLMQVLTHAFRDPIVQMSQAAGRVSLGDVDVTITHSAKDEIGDLGRALQRMVDAIKEQADILEVIAQGDYTVEIPVRSDKDVMNRAINDMVRSNNRMVGNIRSSVVQISGGAQQVAQGAQDLASASTEQAATIEEFSASISQIQQQTEDNSRIATETLQEVNEAGNLMQQSMASMQDMLTAMREMDENSQNISKVIKVIDDIAFQTNILALNAAVEAARAGEHGKGFAVVADEVRNLASKSSEAAKETAALIERNSESVSRGNGIVEQTNESLQAVAVIAGKNAESVTRIDDASQQQNMAMAEITSGIQQLSNVVQGNSATAEQSAAASQEMSAQAAVLSSAVEHFKLLDQDSDLRLPAATVE